MSVAIDISDIFLNVTERQYSEQWCFYRPRWYTGIYRGGTYRWFRQAAKANFDDRPDSIREALDFGKELMAERRALVVEEIISHDRYTHTEILTFRFKNKADALQFQLRCY